MPDRLADLISFNTRNGIDFIEIANPAQTRLRVHFLTTVVVEGTLAGPGPVTITGGETVPAVPVEAILAAAWTPDHRRRPLDPRRPRPAPPDRAAGVPGRLLAISSRDREHGPRPVLRGHPVHV